MESIKQRTRKCDRIGCDYEETEEFIGKGFAPFIMINVRLLVKGSETNDFTSFNLFGALNYETFYVYLSHYYTMAYCV